MSPAILSTKLNIPPFRSNLVPRPQLTERLAERRRQGFKLTLLSAPAGFGKTTLVVEWIASSSSTPERQPGVAWLSLDETDDEPGIFFSYLVAALQGIVPDVGKTTMALLASDTQVTAENLLLPLINDLARHPEPLMLVLDDYHNIQKPAIHEAVGFFIEKQPQNLHVVITTRQDPLLPLTRWRARAWLSEIRLKDLRFTEQEAADFLNRTMGLALEAADIASLENRTEGWIAGLQLAAVSLQQAAMGGGSCGACGFIQEFAGNDRFVMDYLIDEVLCCQTDEVVKFLLFTSILKRFNAALIEAILTERSSENSSNSNAQNVLEYLDRSNLFLIPLDNHREWYRYHHLLADLLQFRLKQQYSDHIPELHERAAIWFETNNFATEAISHALASRDYELAATIIGRTTSSGSQRSYGRASEIVTWIEALPRPTLGAHPELQLQLIRGLVAVGRHQESLRLLDALDNHLRQADMNNPSMRSLKVEAVLNRFLYAVSMGDLETCKALVDEVLQLTPESDLYVRSRAYFSLGYVYDQELKYPEAIRSYEQSLALARAVDAHFAHAATFANLSWCYCRAGNLRKGEEIVREITARELASPVRISMAGSAFAQLCYVLYEKNQLKEAEEAVLHGLDLYQQGNVLDKFGWYHFLLATTRQAMGDLEGAKQAQKEAEEIMLLFPYGKGDLIRSYEFQVRLWMAQGTPEKALVWAREYEKNAPQEVSRGREYADMALVQMLIYESRLAEAIVRLDWWIANAEDGKRLGSLVAWYTWRAIAYFRMGRKTDAAADLNRCLKLAAPEGYVRSIVDAGETAREMMEELRRQISDPALRSYADTLLATFPNSGNVITPPVTTNQSNRDLVEPLTERELEVLQLVADGLSNAEIARKLYLSPNTLKAHTQNIYAKLDAHSRVLVVNKARELHLIK